VKRRTPPWWFGLSILMGGVALWLLARELATGEATAADWLAALATLAGFMAAVLAAWYIARAYDLEQKREQDRADDAKAQQANLVAAWPLPMSHLQQGVGRGTDESSTAFVVLEASAMVFNASFLPVYDVEVEFTMVALAESHDLAKKQIRILPLSYQAKGTEVKVGPTQDRLHLFRLDVPTGSPRPVMQLLVAITFRDAGSRLWRRDEFGRLTLVRDTRGR